MTRLTPHLETRDNPDRWLLTYADMITLLTVFFLMLYSMSVVSKGKFTALATSVRSGFNGVAEGGPNLLLGGGAHTSAPGLRPNNTQKEYVEALQDFQRYVEQQGIASQVTTRTDGRGVVISLLSDKLLFERGQAQLQARSQPVLQRIAQTLRAVPNEIQIEGHTCDLPIRTAQFPSNWELSTARAGAVLRYFTEQAGLPGRRLMAAGYAETRPLAPNASEERRARNRRVDIVLLKTEAQRGADLLRQAEIRRITAQ